MSKRKPRRNVRDRDPYQAREAKKYENPIPSREFILGMMEEHGAPLRFDDIAESLQLAGDPQQREALSRRLNAMQRDGQVVCNRRGGYCVVNHEDLLHGRVIGHPDGFGFMQADEGGDDLYLSPREMRRLWHGDRIVARVAGIDRRGRREAAVVEVLERAFENIVGRLQIEAGVAFLLPDNKRVAQQILITPDRLMGAKHGQMVVVHITEHPQTWRQPLGEVVEILGDHLAPGMATDVAIRANDIPLDWPAEVDAEIAELKPEVPEAAKQGRTDLRNVPLVTIDGADARDFDDAVFCERTKKGWRLLVAIADVSSYVVPGTALDDEAYKRGNSVYFPDRVIPMLPEILSNGLCSLNPKVDRLCMTGELYFDAEGKLIRSRFFEAVMNSHARLTYDQVGAMLLDGDAELCAQHADVLPHLHDLYGLYRLLHEARAERGAIDFDTVETRFRFGDDGKLEEIVPLVRHDAHKLIEECMLAANVAAARHLLRKKMPALYRIHEQPSTEKLSDLREFLAELGLSLDGGDEPTAKDYANLLDKVKDRPDFHVIQVVLLRSMMQAVYSDTNVGHFGLAFPAYTHFTSPIRRYPDLMVHRALKHLLTGEPPEAFEYTHQHLAAMGEHCSATERRADDATRDASDTLKCEFMLDKVGESFDGVISGVNSFGIFVELDGIYVSGLVHITALDYDYFHFDPIGHRLTGDRTGRVYRLGDTLRVKVAAVNIDDRKIDFVLADKVEGPGKGRATGDRQRDRKARNNDKGSATRKSKKDAAGQKSSDKKSQKRDGKTGSRRKRSKGKGKG
ncbi:ribonuclease R [Thiosocius teredinicola]|uniref:ribonuclease R n=1 Tax=Thiosocius teredinicola TaxID=1973002 RepID=UPI0009910CA2